jgi:hypothetical protein
MLLHASPWIPRYALLIAEFRPRSSLHQTVQLVSRQYIPGPETNTAQGCPCSICSRTSYDHQIAGQTIEYQDPVVRTIHSTAASPSSDCVSSLKESIAPYANQTFGSAHPTGLAATVDGPTQTWSVARQAPVLNHILCSLGPVELELQQNQESANAGYEAVGPVPIQSGAVPNEAQAIDMSVPERLRRLARRYVNNPESLVNDVHLAPGPSGRFQVVITIDITDVIGDAIN